MGVKFIITSLLYYIIIKGLFRFNEWKNSLSCTLE